ncbi:MAG TPA: hypothetical protein VIV66_18860 [Pyrinomonadaceae bacterium]
MNDPSSEPSVNQTRAKKAARWLLNRRLIANLMWLVTADKDDPLPPKPRHQNLFSQPVAWLLGRQLISSVKWMLLYAAYQGRLDPRNWMHSELYSFRSSADKEFWFDYLADSGDGQRAMYSIAYLCLSDLWVDGSKPEAPRLNSLVKFAQDHPQTFQLPRGQFLFVGGDTAYHIADYPTLAYRFQLPFHWAATDLGMDKFTEEGRRPLFGIPGNHDYYDQIEGFHRQFRRPVNAEDAPTEAAANRKPRLPQLRIPGFRRCQDASYVAIELPYDWWFWGFDVESGNMDTRQFEFLRKLNNQLPPQKLIVATPEPTTFLGRYIDPESNLSKAFQDLNLPRPFLKNAEPLPPGTCRLDLAGDIHRYARYWGSKSPVAPEGTPSNDHYASVVSGLGGAVIHPWESRAQDILEQVVYPRTSLSRVDVARQLLNPFKLMSGGGLWLLGAVLSVIIYVGGTFPRSSRTVVRQTLWKLLGVNSERTWHLTITFWRQTASVGLLWKSRVGYGPFLKSLAILGSLLPLIAAVIFGAQWTKHLKEQAKIRPVLSWEYWPNWVMYSGALILPGLALWRFGTEPAYLVFADVLFATVVLGMLVGLLYLAIGIGAKGLGKFTSAGFIVLGMLHALLQILPPFLFLRIGSKWSLFLAFVSAIVFASLEMFLVMRQASRWLLLGTWVVFGGLILYLPIGFSNGTARLPVGYGIPVFVVAAALLGMINIGVWFGWYLLVALAFSGHNDEAAGAARVEKYKQFIRFRLTPDSLTGYVIAVDETRTNGRDLRPHVVDVFTVRP